MPEYTVEFMDFAPTTIEVRKVCGNDVEGVDVPAHAMQFAFFDADGKRLAPTYFVTDEVDSGDLASLMARHPGADLFAEGTVDGNYALVRWTHPDGEEWDDEIIVPLGKDIAVVTRECARTV